MHGPKRGSISNARRSTSVSFTPAQYRAATPVRDTGGGISSASATPFVTVGSVGFSWGGGGGGSGIVVEPDATTVTAASIAFPIPGATFSFVLAALVTRIWCVVVRFARLRSKVVAKADVADEAFADDAMAEDKTIVDVGAATSKVDALCLAPAIVVLRGVALASGMR